MLLRDICEIFVNIHGVEYLRIFVVVYCCLLFLEISMFGSWRLYWRELANFLRN